ncbi:retrovirus-related pol polyprotein from transposon TNT 1-94 [Tanacetum coccineum]|uniref:Retrovirus-related pol polyprotein from transposon TNT 1-94 n=1 Tax=Tanacetum coccineum TaxID=301880 RepID=A0ABQ5IH64_9ASTR
MFYQPYLHEYQWTKDHPLEHVIGEPSRPVLTRNKLRSDGDMCMYALTVSTMEPKNVKEAMTDPAWIESLQEELLQFKRLDVWVLVPPLDNIKPLTLKWLFKNKHDEENTVIQNKTRLVVRGYRQEEGIQLIQFFNQSPRGIFINQSNYVLEILKKYGMETCDPVGTPMEIKDKLDVDQNGSPVDAMKYRSMIGALVYLTSSRPDIIDCAGCKYTFKSTSGGAQFLGEKLVSWSSKKQDCTPLSTAKVEYVSLSACCAKEHVEKGTIELYFVKMDYQLADLFTKALPVDRFKYLVRRLGMRSLSPQELDRLAKSKSTRFYRLSHSEIIDIEKVAVRSSLRLPNNKCALIESRANEILRFELKPCQGDSLNRPHHRIRRRCCSLILAESRFKTSCSIDKDKYMMKAQAHVSKSSAISDVQALPQKNIFDKGRLLASFQDLEHEVGDTRTQGSNPTWGDLKITINTLVFQHREAVGEPKKASYRGTQVSREVVMVPEFFEEIDNKQSLSSIQEKSNFLLREDDSHDGIYMDDSPSPVKHIQKTMKGSAGMA